MENPTFSIIIPIYNAEEYLERSIQSVLNQSYKNYELILVNDGSIDKSIFICRNYEALDDRIKVIDSKNCGTGKARNSGLSMAQGIYIYFMDSDDEVKSTFLKDMADVVKDYLPDIVVFGFEMITENSELIGIKIPENKISFNVQNDKSIIDNMICKGVGLSVWDKIIKSQILFEKNIQFDNKKRGQDLSFNAELYKHVKSINSVSFPYYKYRISFRQKPKDEKLLVNLIDNHEKVRLIFNKDIKAKCIDKLFVLWFLKSFPLNIAGYNNLDFSEKLSAIKQLTSNPYLREESDRLSKKKLSIIEQVLVWCFIIKANRILLILGFLGRKIRKIAYS